MSLGEDAFFFFLETYKPVMVEPSEFLRSRVMVELLGTCGSMNEHSGRKERQ